MEINLPVDLMLWVILGAIVLAGVGWVLLKLLRRFAPEFAERVVEQRFNALVALLLAIMIGLMVMPVVLIPVSPGHVGVMWHRFAGGTDTKAPYLEGTVLVFPWDQLIIYSSRYQTREMKVESVTSEGLRVTLDLVIRYRPVRQYIPLLHKAIGQNYADVMLLPEVGSSARLIVSEYTAEQVYTHERQAIHSQIFNHVVNELRLNEEELFKEEVDVDKVSELVHLEDIMIRSVILPERVHAAIINKVNQNYLNQEYDMRLEVANKEAKRKKIEAKGIKDFQETVSGGISETYLRWRGIEATIELAKSNNAKVVVIGSGKDGLPLILNTESTLSPIAATTTPGTNPEGKTNSSEETAAQRLAKQLGKLDHNSLDLSGVATKDTAVEVSTGTYDPRDKPQ